VLGNKRAAGFFGGSGGAGLEGKVSAFCDFARGSSQLSLYKGTQGRGVSGLVSGLGQILALNIRSVGG
jgi:hypothetical protein